jgi:integrase
VYLSPDAIANLRQCLEQHPGEGAHGYAFWNRKRSARPLSVKAIQKKMERYAKAAGITTSCHRLRHTVASNLLEPGGEKEDQIASFLSGGSQAGRSQEEDPCEHAATLCLAAQVGPRGGGPGHRRWESADSESSMPLDN